MTNNVNCHCKDVIYEISQKVFLDCYNIKIKRLCLKLNDKNIDLYKILQKVKITYQLKLLTFIKIYSVFYVMYLQAAVINPLSKQINTSFRSVIVDDQKKWVIDEIIDSHRTKINHHLQYWVKWHNYLWDDIWYNVNNNKFEHSQKLMNAFHVQYLDKPEPYLHHC